MHGIWTSPSIGSHVRPVERRAGSAQISDRASKEVGDERARRRTERVLDLRKSWSTRIVSAGPGNSRWARQPETYPDLGRLEYGLR